MRKLCSRLALAAISTLFFADCENTSPALLDLSMQVMDFAAPPLDLASPAPDLVTCGVCDCGLQIYRVVNAVYPAVAGTGSIVSDTCKTGLVGANVEVNRNVKNDAMGNISILSADGSFIIGAGPVRCNKGTLTSTPVVVTDGTCRYTNSNSVAFTGTADNTFDIVVTQSRSNTTSEPGMTCTQPATCTLTYKASHKL